MIKAVFFDLDETIVDSNICHHKANIAAFAHFGFDYESVKSKSSDTDIYGLRVSEILKLRRDLAGISEAQIPLRELIGIRQKAFLRYVGKEGTILLPGVNKALEYAEKNIEFTAIVSSGTKDYILLVLRSFKLEKFIDFVVSGEDVKKGKPDPECYEKAFQELPDKTIRKSECLVVEDSTNGVLAAKAAGMKVLCVPFAGNPKEMREKVDYKIASLEDFSKIFA